MSLPKNFDPFKNLVLDEYEQEIEDSINEEDIDFNTSKKDQEFWKDVSKRINIRINVEDLARIKAKAKMNNIPYQTLLGTLIHKFSKGEFKITI